MAHHRTESSSSIRSSKDQLPAYIEDDDHVSTPTNTLRENARGERSFDVLSEQSPLLLPQRVSDDDELDRGCGTPGSILGFNDAEEEEETKSVWYLFMLTLSIGG